MTNVAVAGVTVTVANGIGLTVMVAVPVFVSLVAVIVAVPRATAVTSPLALTVALVASDVPHVTVRPESVLPLASSVAAVSCCVAPMTNVAVAGVTVTVATGIGLTVMVAVPVFVSLVAVIVAVPGATAVTSPLVLTVALVASDVPHVTVRPESVLPLASSVVAVSCCVAPMTNVAVAGVTVTVATGIGLTVMVMVAVPVFVSLVAVIVAVPGATAVTSPLALTVALVASDVPHVTARPESVLPLASSVAAVSCCVAPMTNVAVAGVTVTVATGI